MNIIYLTFIAFFIIFGIANAQKLKFQTSDSTNGRHTWQAYIFFKMKLNGVYDITGGLQGQETFNLNKIDVWGGDNTQFLKYSSKLSKYVFI
jgi:hypothetical protein